MTSSRMTERERYEARWRQEEGWMELRVIANETLRDSVSRWERHHYPVFLERTGRRGRRGAQGVRVWWYGAAFGQWGGQWGGQWVDLHLRTGRIVRAWNQRAASYDRGVIIDPKLLASLPLPPTDAPVLCRSLDAIASMKARIGFATSLIPWDLQIAGSFDVAMGWLQYLRPVVDRV